MKNSTSHSTNPGLDLVILLFSMPGKGPKSQYHPAPAAAAGTAIGPRRGFPETAPARTSENNRQLSGIIGLTCGYVFSEARIPGVTSKPPETDGIIAQRRDPARARHGKAARPAFAASRHPAANPPQRARGKRNPEGSSSRAQRSNRCMEGPRRGRARCHAELGKNQGGTARRNPAPQNQKVFCCAHHELAKSNCQTPCLGKRAPSGSHPIGRTSPNALPTCG